jgi:hypothetical protein
MANDTSSTTTGVQNSDSNSNNKPGPLQRIRVLVKSPMRRVHRERRCVRIDAPPPPPIPPPTPPPGPRNRLNSPLPGTNMIHAHVRAVLRRLLLLSGPPPVRREVSPAITRHVWYRRWATRPAWSERRWCSKGGGKRGTDTFNEADGRARQVWVRV